MSWFSVEKIDEKTFAISEYGHWEKVRSFLLIGIDQALMIDCGLGVGNIKKIVRNLTNKPIKVVLTHVHWDHIGGAKFFEDIYVHTADSEWLKNGIPAWNTASVRKEIERDRTKPFPDNFSLNDFKLYQGKPTGLLKHNDIFQLGNRDVQVIHTPGHSPGHISLLDLTNNYLFPGDILYSRETPIYANYPSTNPKNLIDSLELIANLPNIKRIFASHNQLELSLTYLDDLKEAIYFIRKNKLDSFGTGLHKFEKFNFLF